MKLTERMKLTEKTIERIRPTDTRQEIADHLVRNLYFIIQPSGVRSWAVRFWLHGRGYKKTLGSFPALSLAKAREMARADLLLVARKINPLAQQHADPGTVASLVEEFLEKHVQGNCRPKSIRETTRLLRDKALPKWKHTLAKDISRRDVIALLDGLVANPATANRTFAALRKCFNWAVSRDLLAVSPCAGVKPPAKEKKRTRFLTDRELTAVYRAAGELDWPFGPYIQMLILTGQRRSEVAHMQWSEIDLKSRTWVIPAAKAKNGSAHVVPLSAHAIAVLETVPHVDGTDLIFSTTGDTAVSGFSKAKRELDSMLPPKTVAWRFHDLRRTVATGLQKLGVRLEVTEAVLNHVSGSRAGIVGVYQLHDYSEEKREALERWGQHVAGLKKRTAIAA
jgi:integrase